MTTWDLDKEINRLIIVHGHYYLAGITRTLIFLHEQEIRMKCVSVDRDIFVRNMIDSGFIIRQGP